MANEGSLENSSLEKITAKLRELSIKNDPWQQLWQKPLVQPHHYLGRGRGIVPANTKEQLALFFRLYSFNFRLSILKDKDLASANKHLTSLFHHQAPNPQILDFLTLAHQQQPPSFEPKDNVIANWLTLSPPKETRKKLAAYTHFCQEMSDFFTSLEKPNHFSQALIEDMTQINQATDDIDQILFLNLRKQIAQELFSRLDLFRSKKGENQDQLLVNLINANSENYYVVLALEKLYLSGLAINLKEVDDALRTPQSAELQQKEGRHFNLEIDDVGVNKVMIEAQKETDPKKIAKLFQCLSSQTLLKTTLAYYLDSWSRHWLKDEEYTAFFQNENAFLQGSCLPIVNDQLVIPDVFLDKKNISDLVLEKITKNFCPKHLPKLELPVTANITQQKLSFQLGTEAIGHFSGERLNS